MSEKPGKIGEIANYSQSVFSGFLNQMPTLFADLNLSNYYKTFRVMRRYDSHIVAVLKQRIKNVLRRQWSVNPTDESDQALAIADLVKSNIENLGPVQLFQALLNAVPDGFATLQLTWEMDATGKWTIVRYKHLFPELFGFAENEDLLMADQTQGIRVSPGEAYANLSRRYPYSFVTHTNEKEFSDPRGHSAMAASYWAWKFKKAGLSFWLKMLEKYGVPTVVALMEKNGSEEQHIAKVEEITDALRGQEVDSAIAVWDIKEIKVLEAKGRGSDFIDFLHFLNNEISKAILTETLTVETQGTGSFALGEKHFEILQDWISESDAVALGDTINNQIVKRIVDLNFGEQDQYPTVVFSQEKLAPFSDVLEMLKLGFPVDAETVRNAYNIPIAEEGTDKEVLIYGNSVTVQADSGKNFVYAPRNPYADH